ncbi:MAG: squalene/phytoene synthase family protein [Anaerolineae bacterium]|nr:squalene/phytoene synthase family protein [Anaerolineae bacterium]
MSNQAVMTVDLKNAPLEQAVSNGAVGKDNKSSQALAAAITKAASKQTYYTVRLLVDHPRISEAYRAYAYFRWVDDWLDGMTCEQAACRAFVTRQQTLMERCYQGELLPNLTVEETMLVDLIRSDPSRNSGLQAYVRHMMAVMVFDANRRGRLISQVELTAYSRHLATAVTEALHYFIGHDQPAPRSQTRYLAATGAHIAHMLRDACDDNAAGYFNIPGEFLTRYGITPQAVDSAPYRLWVKRRVQMARDYFQAGRDYLSQVENWRCRLAGYAYMARFTGVLDAIERDHYLLRSDYSAENRWGAGLSMGWSVLSLLL